MAFTQITLTATFTRPDGSAAQGKVTATLSQAIQNGTAILDPTPVVGILNAAGALQNSSGVRPFTLEANDDPATLPQGSTYAFVVELDSAPVREFEAIVPHTASAGTIDLSALEPTLP
jgi:hypothetical protein